MQFESVVALKKNVMIRIDAELVEKAKELGLNISKVCENALIQAVKALEETFTEKGGNLGTVGSWWWTRGDLNPRPRRCQRRDRSRLIYSPFFLYN